MARQRVTPPFFLSRCHTANKAKHTQEHKNNPPQPQPLCGSTERSGGRDDRPRRGQSRLSFRSHFFLSSPSSRPPLALSPCMPSAGAAHPRARRRQVHTRSCGHPRRCGRIRGSVSAPLERQRTPPQSQPLSPSVLLTQQRHCSYAHQSARRQLHRRPGVDRRPGRAQREAFPQGEPGHLAPPSQAARGGALFSQAERSQRLVR